MRFLTATLSAFVLAGVVLFGQGVHRAPSVGLSGTTGTLGTLGANVAVTNLVQSANNAMYEVCGFEAVTRAATTSSTMPAVTIKFNNGVAQTFTLIASAAGNTTTTFGQGCVILRSAAGQAITYDAGTTSGAFATAGATSMQYELTVTARQIS
jgi:hypothetical protein